MALETVNNPYLGTDSSLLVSAETSTRIDAVVLETIFPRQLHSITPVRSSLERGFLAYFSSEARKTSSPIPLVMAPWAKLVSALSQGWPTHRFMNFLPTV